MLVLRVGVHVSLHGDCKRTCKREKSYSVEGAGKTTTFEILHRDFRDQ